jgi:hypothetical protein
MDAIAIGIDLLHDFIAQRGRDPTILLSTQIRAAALQGDKLARRVLSSGALSDPAPLRLPRSVVPPKITKTPQQIERARVSAEQHRLLQRDIDRGLFSTGARHSYEWPRYGALRGTSFMARDLTGQRFGSWVVVKLAETLSYDGKNVRMWLTQCLCGEPGRVSSGNLRSGKSRQCKRCGMRATARARAQPQY